MEEQRSAEFPFCGRTTDAVNLLIQHVGPQQYWLHNRVGGLGWYIDLKSKKIWVKDPFVSSFLILKLS
jgi:hypothetical protein